MSEEYVIEIEDFSSIKEAKEFVKAHILTTHNKQINIVSRDITVVNLSGEES